MTTTSIIIRRVRIDEAAQFRDLRLASLQETPDAFASSYEEEEHWTAEFYAERQRSEPDNFIIGAFDNINIICIEKDPTLAKHCTDKFKQYPNISVICDDAIYVDKYISNNSIDIVISTIPLSLI